MRYASISKLAALCLLAPVITFAATWLEEVAPVISSAERQTYLQLKDGNARRAFEEAFWSGRAITAEEYSRRLAFIDSQYGSGQLLSGSNTDRGRVYLSLGAPDEIQRLPSSRLFYPLEIWRYRSASAAGSSAGLQCLFFQRNGTGEYHLYSPTLDTIRALLNPQSGARGLFPVNEIVTAADIRNRLSLAPVESDVIEAATGVARGVTGMGNEEMLAIALAPREALKAKGIRSEVKARVVFQPVRVIQTWNGNVAAVDLEAPVSVQEKIRLTLLWRGHPVERAETALPFERATPVLYRHRLWLLPGEYAVALSVDGREQTIGVTVAPRNGPGELLIGESAPPSAGSRPFQFGAIEVTPAESGSVALLQLDRPQTVKWRLLKGGQPVWSAETASDSVTPEGYALASLPNSKLAEGSYELEARGAGWTRIAPFTIASRESNASVISYNANRRELSIARIYAVRHDLDAAREALRPLLAREPRHFEALALMGDIERELQDETAAVRYYRRAWEVRPEPALERAIEQLSRGSL